LEENREVQRIKVEKQPYCIAFSSDGSKAFVTNQYSDSVSIIDIKSKLVEKNILIGGFPEGIDSHDGLVYVVNWMDEELVIFDELTLEKTQTLQLGVNPRNFGKFIFFNK
jgi:YVTN family beta-propeller protein